MLDWSVIIVNWNVKDRLRECLRSVFASERAGMVEVFVVDNASSDGSAEMVETEFPRACLIRNKENKGFAAANNQAFRVSRGSHILLLNPDCELEANALLNLKRVFANHPRAGVVGGRLHYDDGFLQRSVRNFPTFRSQAAILLKLPHLMGPLRSVDKYLAKEWEYGRGGAAPQVMGAFFAISRQVLSEVGLFDEKFFLWFEEVDYCRRVKEAGYEVYYTPSAVAVHVGGESFKQMMSASKQKIWNKSLSHYIRKHHGLLPWLALQPLRPVSIGLSWLVDRFGNKTIWKK